nr:hypothetical protein [Bacteroidota bacterium]
MSEKTLLAESGQKDNSDLIEEIQRHVLALGLQAMPIVFKKYIENHKMDDTALAIIYLQAEVSPYLDEVFNL